MKKVIGTVTKYIGTELPGLTGEKVLITAINRLEARPDYSYDDEHEDPDHYVGTDEHLDSLGGITAADRVDVQPFSDRFNAWSFVHYNPKAIDLECFAGLADKADVPISSSQSNHGRVYRYVHSECRLHRRNIQSLAK